jgi:serine phosphatase RsbU (regulator of sigma subunit)/tetratricopeptide (TPR) repeat protein
MIRFFHSLIFSIFFGLILCHAQNVQKIDSLTKALNNTIADTEKVNIYNALAFEYLYSEPDKSFNNTDKAINLSKRISYTKGIGSSLNSFGNIYLNRGNYDSALFYYSESLKIFEGISERTRIAMCLNNIGTAYHLKGDYAKTIEYYNNSLKIREEINDKKGISDCLNNIGIVYSDQGNYSKALEYYFKALPIKNALGDKRGIASILSNIAVTYSYKSELSSISKTSDLMFSISYLKQALQLYIELGNIKGIADCQVNMCSKYFELEDYDKALEYVENAKLNYEKTNDNRGLSYCYVNYADIYQNQKNFPKAVEYLELSLRIRQEIGHKMGMGECLYKLGKIYIQQKKYAIALTYFNQYLTISEEMESLEDRRRSYENLALIYAETGNFRKAYDYQVLFKKMQDSIINTDNTKKITQLEMNFQFEQKQREQQLLQLQKDAIKAIELKKQKLIKNSFILGFLLTLLFSFFIFRSYRINKKKNIILAEQKNEILQKNTVLSQQKEEITAQRDEIETQKNEIFKQHHIIEIKNKNITDSIKYAQRIQQAILPSDEKLDKILKDYFVYYLPKDIVSGDFYWAEQYVNPSGETIELFAVVDCTGHGVPGAFMSLLGYNGLNQAVNEYKLRKPSDILNFLSNYISEMLRRHKEDRTVKDGMDLFLCSLNRKSNVLEYAGVHNSALVLRSSELMILKSDVHAIGEPFNDWFNGYTNNQFILQKDDFIYLFTDGYIDQFGGQDRKKFMKKRFRDLLIEIHPLTMKVQKNRLGKIFTDWKGDEVQIDDNLIIGIKV